MIASRTRAWLQAQFLAFNEWAGDEIVRFVPYALDKPAANGAAPAIGAASV
jgi:hypothetical protein